MQTIGKHLFRVFDCIRAHDERWFTARDIAERAEIAERTARSHLQALANAGVAECAKLFPAYRYRYAPQPQAKELMESLHEAGRVFGAEETSPQLHASPESAEIPVPIQPAPQQP